MVVLSAAAHLVGCVVLVLSPYGPRLTRSVPTVVRVDLVAMAPPAAVRKPRGSVPRPVPKPKPKPEPKPKPKPKPVVEKKVLPKDPVAKPKSEPIPPAPAVEERSYEDVLAELRRKDAERFPEPAPSPRATTPAARVGPAGGPGRLISPEEAVWRDRARAYMLRSWVLSPGFRTQDLLTVIDVDLSSSGEILGTRIVQRSGNPWYDESVERAVRKAAPLPRPPVPGVWQFRFSPRDLQ